MAWYYDLFHIQSDTRRTVGAHRILRLPILMGRSAGL
jgi:hypothetical protein